MSEFVAMVHLSLSEHISSSFISLEMSPSLSLFLVSNLIPTWVRNQRPVISSLLLLCLWSSIPHLEGYPQSVRPSDPPVPFPIWFVPLQSFVIVHGQRRETAERPLSATIPRRRKVKITIIFNFFQINFENTFQMRWLDVARRHGGHTVEMHSLVRIIAFFLLMRSQPDRVGSFTPQWEKHQRCR